MADHGTFETTRIEDSMAAIGDEPHSVTVITNDGNGHLAEVHARRFRVSMEADAAPQPMAGYGCEFKRSMQHPTP